MFQVANRSNDQRTIFGNVLIEFEPFSDTARRALCAITEQSVTHDIGSRPSSVGR